MYCESCGWELESNGKCANSDCGRLVITLKRRMWIGRAAKSPGVIRVLYGIHRKRMGRISALWTAIRFTVAVLL